MKIKKFSLFCCVVLLFSCFLLTVSGETLTDAGKQLAQHDTNRDGSINIADVTALLTFLSGQTDTSPESMERYDINRDDKINISDVTALLNYLAGENCTYIKKTIEGAAPTCTQSGLTQGGVCERCGEILVE